MGKTHAFPQSVPMLVEVFTLVFVGVCVPSAALTARGPLGTFPGPCSCPDAHGPTGSVKDTLDESKRVREYAEEIRLAERELKHLGWKRDRVVEYHTERARLLKDQTGSTKRYAKALEVTNFRTAEYYQQRMCALFSRAEVLGDKDALMAARHVCMGRTKISLSTEDTNNWINCPCSPSYRAAAVLLSTKPSDTLKATLKELKANITAAKAAVLSEPAKWNVTFAKDDQEAGALFNTSLKNYAAREALEDTARDSVQKKICDQIDAGVTVTKTCGSIDGLLGLPKVSR